MQQKLDWNINNNIKLSNSLKAAIEFNIKLQEANKTVTANAEKIKLDVINVESQYKAEQLRFASDTAQCSALSRKIEDLKTELTTHRRVNQILEHKAFNAKADLQKVKNEQEKLRVTIKVHYHLSINSFYDKIFKKKKKISR